MRSSFDYILARTDVLMMHGLKNIEHEYTCVFVVGNGLFFTIL